jgi:hypothetical protein
MIPIDTTTLRTLTYRLYDLRPDGRAFLVVVSANRSSSDPPAPATQVDVVVNWFDELKARVPTK